MLSIPHMEPCPFCEYFAERNACAFVERTQRVAAFVNIRQYERGALLVAPLHHATDVLTLEAVLLSEVHVMAARMARAQMRAFGTTGVNIFQNNGIDAGQTVPHFHVHVVPRYPGSDPRRVFRERDFPVLPLAQLQHIAEAVRAHL